jgi:hypothetical protein
MIVSFVKGFYKKNCEKPCLLFSLQLLHVKRSGGASITFFSFFICSIGVQMFAKCLYNTRQ